MMLLSMLTKILEEKRRCDRTVGGPLFPGPLSGKDDTNAYYLSSTSRTFSLTLIITHKVGVHCPANRGGHDAQVAKPQLEPRPARYHAHLPRLPLLAYVCVDTFEQLSCKFREEAVFLSHQARLRTRTRCVSSSAGGVVGGPVWFGFNGRL